MSGFVLYGGLLLLNLLGMMVLMITSKRHIDKFQHKLPLLFRSKLNTESDAYNQESHITRRQCLRWLGLILLAVAFLLTYSSYQTGYFVVVWFGSLTLAAGLVYVAMLIYEQRVSSQK